MDLTGRFFDGQSARGQNVRITVSSSGLYFSGDVERHWSWDALVVLDPPAKPLPARLGYSAEEGAVLEVSGDAWKYLQSCLPRRNTGVAIPGTWRAVFYSALAAAATIFLFIVYMPRLIDGAAVFLPEGQMMRLGQAVIAGSIDGDACIAPEGGESLDRLVRLLAPDDDGAPVRLVSVASDERMVNAFAFPGGYVVIGRGLLDLAENQAELAGVLAHEIGHVRKRHPEQAMLRALGVGITLSAMFGDAGILSNAAGIGEFLSGMHYSRKKEIEADEYAARVMVAAGMDPRATTILLRRVTEGHGLELGGLEKYISTHPALEEREKVAGLAAESGPFRDPLTTGEWAAIKAICDETAAWPTNSP